ncbi:hypothetical protein HMPREF1986_00272 [Oribacterium sp. oral taxon 078 str. F0263]|nr:hypothetical protein [Oribacterium sp. oral taxon 078]ERL22785.1 hypothetical protein HMPREF1986_00272 [Oribacterium sp. oral taxon 078 str. F0263]
MTVVMTPEELRDYIRFMPADEVLRITIEYREAEKENGGEGSTETL